MSDIIESLLKMLVERSLKVEKDELFLLSSGLKSKFYIDCKLTTLHGDGAFLTGIVFSNVIRSLDEEVQAVGGLEFGAAPIAVSTAIMCTNRFMPVSAFSIRKTPKNRGLRSPIDGPVLPGDRVVVVEDVVTTGESTLKAIEVSRNYGLDVLGVIVLVDRQENNGLARIKELVPKTKAIFSLSELNGYYTTHK
jgi:orotate phosphoribosyltransferase